MFRYFYALRYVAAVAVISSYVGCAIMFAIGAVKTIKACAVYFTDWHPSGTLDGISEVTLTTKYIIQSLDLFLVALVLMIFSFAVYGLVLREVDTDKLPASRWLQITSISELKSTLAEVIIIILFVQFLEMILLKFDQLDWKMLVLPLGIALLAVSLKLLGLRESPR